MTDTSSPFQPILHDNDSNGVPPSSTTAKRSAVSRRDFLSLTWKGLLGLSGLLGLAGLCRFLSFQTEPAPITHYDLGLAENYPIGIQAKVPEAQAVVLHTPDGFMAYSLVCPHLGCVVDSNNEGFACPCHGSRFAKDGTLMRGPADRSLRTLKLEVTADGHLILDTAES
jgi:cytochrome b6-f complex iron-sulfur subunit